MNVLREMMLDEDKNLSLMTEDISIEKELLSVLDSEKDYNRTLDGLKTLHEIYVGVGKINNLVSIENITKNKDYTDLESSLNIILKPAGMNVTLPVNEGGINENTISIAKEGIKETLKKIKDFIVGLYKKFITAMKKFFGSVTAAYDKIVKKVGITNKIIEQVAENVNHPNFTFKINFYNLAPPGKETDREYWISSMSASMAFANIFVHPNAIKSFVNNVTSTEVKTEDTTSLFKTTENILSVIKVEIEKQRALIVDPPVKIEKNNRLVTEYFQEMLGGSSLCYTTSEEDYAKGINEERFVKELDYFQNAILKNIGWNVKTLNEKNKSSEIEISPQDFRVIKEVMSELKTFANTMKNLTEEFEKVKKDLDTNMEIKILSLYDVRNDNLTSKDLTALSSVGKILNKAYEVMTEPSVKLSTYFIRTVNTLDSSIHLATAKALTGVK